MNVIYTDMGNSSGSCILEGVLHSTRQVMLQVALTLVFFFFPLSKNKLTDKSLVQCKLTPTYIQHSFNL